MHAAAAQEPVSVKQDQGVLSPETPSPPLGKGEVFHPTERSTGVQPPSEARSEAQAPAALGELAPTRARLAGPLAPDEEFLFCISL